MARKTKRDPMPFARLLVAEAEYLNARGWAPFVPVPRVVVWQDPKDTDLKRRYRQDVAVRMQREREPNSRA